MQIITKFILGFLIVLVSVQSYSTELYFRENSMKVTVPSYFMFNVHSAIDGTAPAFISKNHQRSTSRIFVGSKERCDLCSSKKYLSDSRKIDGLLIEIHELPRGRSKGFFKITVIYDRYYYVEVFDDLEANTLEYWSQQINTHNPN